MLWCERCLRHSRHDHVFCDDRVRFLCGIVISIFPIYHNDVTDIVHKSVSRNASGSCICVLGSTQQDLYVHKWSVSKIPRSNKLGRRRRVLFSFVEEGVGFVALMFMSRDEFVTRVAGREGAERTRPPRNGIL